MIDFKRLKMKTLFKYDVFSLFYSEYCIQFLLLKLADYLTEHFNRLEINFISNVQWESIHSLSWIVKKGRFYNF